MRDANPQIIRLEDYTPPAWLVDDVLLDVDILADHVRIHATSRLRRNPASADATAPLMLDGDDLQHRSVTIDGKAPAPAALTIDESHLVLRDLPSSFVLETVVTIDPFRNTRLMGFFQSKDGLFSQCEAQGFRRITWFPDRPDVMARYTVTLHADRARYPALLANGNLIASGEEPGGRHWARWEDPFPKPSYLFAMVAARLDVLEDDFTTASGRKALLQVWVEPGKQIGRAHV